jgi:MHS family proline/betaine transporter-like MFS transporter
MQDPPAGVELRRYRKVLVAASIGNLIEIYDLLIYGYFAVTLAQQFFPPGDPVAALLATFAIFAVGFVVRPVGAVIFGHVGDRFGRRTALAFSLLLMTLATVAFGLLPTYATVGILAPTLLLLCRLVQGLSASAEIPGAMLLIMEHAPVNRRGLTASINNAAGSLATAAAATVSLILASVLSPDQLATWGWRVAFLIAAPIGLVGLYVRIRLLDSPAFVALGERARQGRAPLAQALGTAKRGMLVLIVWFGAQTIGGYTLSVLMPSYLIRGAGLSPADAYAANLIAVLAVAAAAPLGGYLVDRFPLRRMAIAVMAGAAVTAVPGFLIITTYRTLGGAVIGQVLCGVFVGAAYTVGAVAAMTLFPIGIRFTALALPLSIAITLFGSTAPYVSTWLATTTHNALAPAFYLLAAATAGTLAAIFGLPRRDALPPARKLRSGTRSRTPGPRRGASR